MKNTMGLDHPLVAVKDLAATRTIYKALGFQLSPQGQHPWGTATSFILFHHQLLELVSIGDPSLLDGYAAGDFLFGRHIENQLNKCEGVALTALYTADADKTEAILAGQYINCEGTIEFGRDVIRPDGIPDRTCTTLKVFPNNTLPRLSIFACQQHRRDLLEFPELMEHPNGAHGIDAVTVLCNSNDRVTTIDWLSRLHNTDPVDTAPGETTIETANGCWRVCDLKAIERRFGPNNLSLMTEYSPTVIGIDIRTSDLSKTSKHLNTTVKKIDEALVLSDMRKLGGVMLRFVTAPIPKGNNG